MNPPTNHTTATSSDGAASLGSTKRPASVDVAASDKPKHKMRKIDPGCTPLAPVNSAPARCPFTDAFFADMAVLIRDTFPISRFAETYHCTTKDVLDALNAVVLRPLCMSSQDELSVSDHAQVVIADWRDAVAKASNDIITISDSSPDTTHLPLSSPVPESPETAPLFDTHLSSIFTSQQQPSSPPSSPNICNAEPAGKRTPDPKTCLSPATMKRPPQSPTKPIASTPAPPKKKRKNTENPTSTRVEVRRDYSGLLIPIANWIEGYHRHKLAEPLQPGQVDGMTDEEFERRLQAGWLKEILDEEERDQVACAKPGLRRRRGKR